MNFKAISAVVILAVLIGVLYVVFEKNFFPEKMSQSSSSSSQEIPKNAPTQSKVLDLPTPEPTLPPITASSDLPGEASKLDMRDYSTYFEDLKSKVKQ